MSATAVSVSEDSKKQPSYEDANTEGRENALRKRPLRKSKNQLLLVSEESQSDQSEPLILEAAEEAIENFRARYQMYNDDLDPSLEPHKRVIDKLSEVSDQLHSCRKRHEELRSIQNDIKNDENDFKEFLLKHAALIDEHCKMQTRIERYVGEMQQEMVELTNMSEIESCMQEIEELTQRKTKLLARLSDNEMCESFVIKCTDKHFHQTSEPMVKLLIEKFYSLQESHEDLQNACADKMDAMRLARMENKKYKMKLQTDILEDQRLMTSIPDVDLRRVAIVDIEREILANEVRTNQKEAELLELQLAADTLYDYLEKFVRFTEKPTNSLQKLDRVQQFVQDVEKIFLSTANFDINLNKQISFGDSTMRSVCDADEVNSNKSFQLHDEALDEESMTRDQSKQTVI